jgi:hypothetical protein
MPLTIIIDVETFGQTVGIAGTGLGLIIGGTGMFLSLMKEMMKDGFHLRWCMTVSGLCMATVSAGVFCLASLT